MKVAITGASGFIGRELSKFLVHKGFRVISVVSKHDSSVLGVQRGCDITNASTLEDVLVDADVVVHLAAVTKKSRCLEDFDEAYRINVEGTRNVLKCTKSKRLVMASSYLVYGEPSSQDGICSENQQLNGKSPYALTKILAETLCNNYMWNYNHRINIIRFFNLYGERQDKNNIIPSLVLSSINDRSISIRNGKSIRDFLYLSDAIHAIFSVIVDGKEGQTYNVASGTGISISSIAEHLAKKIGKTQIEDLHIDTGDPPKVIADISKLKSLGWKQEISMEDGLDKMLNFYRHSKS